MSQRNKRKSSREQERKAARAQRGKSAKQQERTSGLASSCVALGRSETSGCSMEHSSSLNGVEKRAGSGSISTPSRNRCQSSPLFGSGRPRASSYIVQPRLKMSALGSVLLRLLLRMLL